MDLMVDISNAFLFTNKIGSRMNECIDVRSVYWAVVGKRQPGVDQPPTGAVSLKHIYHIAATRQMHEQFKYHNLQELSQLVAYKCKELNVHVLDQVDQQTADYYLNWRYAAIKSRSFLTYPRKNCHTKVKRFKMKS